MVISRHNELPDIASEMLETMSSNIIGEPSYIISSRRNHTQNSYQDGRFENWFCSQRLLDEGKTGVCLYKDFH